MGVEPFLLASAMKMVISQRLAKRICKHCKKEHTIKEWEEKKIKEILAPIVDKEDLEHLKFYQGEGCDKCNHT